MQIQRLESDIYVLVGETYRSNSVVFLSGDEALIVDAMASPSDAESLRRWVEDELKKHVRFIVCTHYFSDHLAALRLFPQSRIIAHTSYRHTFDSELFRTPEERAHFVEPDILISDRMLMKWGRYRLDIFHNPGHTLSTLNIDVSDADLLLVGDTVVGNIVYLVYSTPPMFQAALERARRRGRSRLISSHNEARSGRAIDNAMHYLDALRMKVEAIRRGGDSGEAILDIDLRSCLAPGVEGSSFEGMFHNRNLSTIVERNLFAEL